MKKIIPLIVIAVIAVASFSNASAAAYASAAAQYALMASDTPFYAVTGDGYDVKTYLPSSYYVTVEGTSGTYYRVSYGDLTGYVRQSAVTQVDYEPVTKYAYGSATLKSGIASVFLYESSDLSRVLATVGSDTAVDVYGYVDSGMLVYYCRIRTNNSYVRGYVSPAGVNVVMPEKNDGSKIVPPPEPDDSKNAGTTPEEDEPASYVLQIVLVVALVVPSVIAVLLIFSGKKRPEEEGEEG